LLQFLLLEAQLVELLCGRLSNQADHAEGQEGPAALASLLAGREVPSQLQELQEDVAHQVVLVVLLVVEPQVVQVALQVVGHPAAL
jgi:hypothetical protein